eukprot:TRINITY_DN9794_c0_g1_i1.p1 TRINITY_DN9794_c0_g1~~TRINITY_DN9794_c0_g1_i1.p1  ORF type:complete len:198 (+),score=41.13 TRINITY_DN9794_c0_g1_i1:75-596(+)
MKDREERAIHSTTPMNNITSEPTETADKPTRKSINLSSIATNTDESSTDNTPPPTSKKRKLELDSDYSSDSSAHDNKNQPSPSKRPRGSSKLLTNDQKKEEYYKLKQLQRVANHNKNNSKGAEKLNYLKEEDKCRMAAMRLFDRIEWSPEEQQQFELEKSRPKKRFSPKSNHR